MFPFHFFAPASAAAGGGRWCEKEEAQEVAAIKRSGGQSSLDRDEPGSGRNKTPHGTRELSLDKALDLHVAQLLVRLDNVARQADFFQKPNGD
ncbi:MAG TPA: hypothetical protein VF306_20580, partial [Pirellulales bacterium]